MQHPAPGEKYQLMDTEDFSSLHARAVWKKKRCQTYEDYPPMKTMCYMGACYKPCTWNKYCVFLQKCKIGVCVY